MRVAVVAESFLPSVNGVAGSVCKVLDHLRLRGHDAMVICPAPAPSTYAGFPVHAVGGFSYHQFAVGVPTPDLRPRLAAFAPDIVHAASPFVLGAAGVFAAARLWPPRGRRSTTCSPTASRACATGGAASTARCSTPCGARTAARWLCGPRWLRRARCSSATSAGSTQGPT